MEALIYHQDSFQLLFSAFVRVVPSRSDVERLLRDRYLRDHVHIPPRVRRWQQVEHGLLIAMIKTIMVMVVVMVMMMMMMSF